MTTDPFFYEDDTLGEIIRESWLYHSEKPFRVPPADSFNRIQLAKLWMVAHKAITKRPKARTFSYAGARFGVAYVGNQMLVMHWSTRNLLVRSPTSMQSLLALLNPHPEPP